MLIFMTITNVTVYQGLDMDQKMLPLYQILGRFDYEDFKTRVPSRHPQTCEWFLNHQTYHSWLEDQEDSLLWLSLDPGCGKSVLMKHLVDSLQATDPGCICYFFFKSDGDIEQRNLAHAFSAILHQLFTAFPKWINRFKDDYERHGANIVRMGTKLMRMFMNVPQKIESPNTTIFCLLDGIDECEEHNQHELLNEISNVLTQLPNLRKDLHDTPKIKFLIASRPYPHIEQRLRKVLNSPHGYHLNGESLTGELSQEIEIFTTSRVCSHKSPHKLP
jgi:hypothetical protein